MTKDINENYPELAGVISVKYFLSINSPDSVDDCLEYAGTFGVLNLYENKYYIPMGFTYDRMISRDLFEKIETDKEKHKVYAGYMVADNPSDFKGILWLCDDEYKAAESEEEYLELVNERRKGAAYSVTETADGYKIDISPEKQTVMCLSVSYNNNWKAYIDGAETPVYEVNNGLVGVILPEGNHTVELKYTVAGFAEGLVIAGAGGLILIGYVVISRKKSAHTAQK